MIFPPSWEVLRWQTGSYVSSRFGPVDGRVLPVADQQGLWGLVNTKGEWQAACTYRAMISSASDVYVQAMRTGKSERWDLLSEYGESLNPEGVSIIPDGFSSIASHIRAVK